MTKYKKQGTVQWLPGGDRCVGREKGDGRRCAQLEKGNRRDPCVVGTIQGLDCCVGHMSLPRKANCIELNTTHTHTQMSISKTGEV